MPEYQNLEISYSIEYYPLDKDYTPKKTKDFIEIEHELRTNVCKEIIEKKNPINKKPNLPQPPPPLLQRSQTPPPKERRVLTPKRKIRL